FRSWAGRTSGLTTALPGSGGHRCHASSEVSSSPSPGPSPPTTARPCLTPRWKLAKRSRVAAADLADGVGADASAVEAAAVPGTRLARGTRFGSPACVMPPDDGE